MEVADQAVVAVEFDDDIAGCPAAKPARSAILFRKKPLNRISSGSAVLKIAYTNTAGIALTPSPENSDVAVSTFLRE